MSDFATIDLADIQKLLDSYSVHAIVAEESPTLMEIAGIPYREAVYSNFLGFLLDTEQVHGFGPLFIRSLMKVYSCRCPDDWPLADLDPESIQATESVERETRTDSDKRIDILIECADFVVCIENKIWSGLHNDLDDYRKHCEKRSDGDRHRVVGIVLSPSHVTDPSLQNHRFVSVTYSHVVDEVRQRMGSYLGSHNTQYQYLLFDFLEQASRLARTNTMSDDQRRFLDFWRENEDKIDNIQSMRDELQQRVKKVTGAHAEQCGARLTEDQRQVFKMWNYRSNVAVFDIANRSDNKRPIFLDVEFHPLRIIHTLGGREREALALEIGRKCEIEFDNSSGRPSSRCDQSPLDESGRERAVETSVAILRVIADLRLAGN